MQIVTWVKSVAFRLIAVVSVPSGYANEVGEAFRALVPVSMVWASYAVATAYVSADAVDKGKKAAVVSVWRAVKRSLAVIDATEKRHEPSSINKSLQL